MKVLKTPTVSITAGLLVSLIVMARLLFVASEWRLGSDATLIGFLSDPARLFFAIYIAVLLFSIWLVRGTNNRLMYTLWCLGNSVHYFLYWAGLELFLYNERNIYVLNWLATTCAIPILLLFRYRTFLVIHLLAVLVRFNIYKENAIAYFEEIKTTDFEIKLRRGASIWFSVECVFAIFFTLFALAHGLGFSDSLRQAITKSGLPNPFPIYHWVLNFFTIYFTVLVLVNSIRDYKKPDWQSASTLSESQRRELIKGRKPSKFDPF